MSYKVEVRSLSESLASSRVVRGSFDAPDVELGGQTYLFDEPVVFEVTLTNTGAGIVASGTATARVTTPCVRCLCDTCIAIEAEVEGFYVRPGHEDEFPEEQEIELIGDDSTIDLEPAITQSIVVDLPFAPVHAPDCKGICPVCGADRNISSCACEVATAVSPFDALKDFDPNGPSAS
jgi:uncharacterized protein